jgi:hypothetical protein
MVCFENFIVSKKSLLNLQTLQSLCIAHDEPNHPLFLISLLSKARTRRDKLKVAMVIMTVIAQQNGHANAANLRRMAHTTSSDDLVVHLLACLREETRIFLRVNDPHNSDSRM